MARYAFLLRVVVPVLACATASAPVWSVDADAAQALLKKSDCVKCHAVDKKKDGPSYKETASKYKGKSDAEQTLIKHITTGPKVKVDGKEEDHPKIKSTKDDEIKNVVEYILSR